MADENVTWEDSTSGIFMFEVILAGIGIGSSLLDFVMFDIGIFWMLSCLYSNYLTIVSLQ